MKVLVIDDQRSARRVICLMLGDLDDLELVEAGSLAEAQSAVEQSNFDLLLVDIRLSDSPTDRGGLDLLRWLRSASPVRAVGLPYPLGHGDSFRFSLHCSV